MIFVTVGTHEQNFNRLIKKIDELKSNDIIEEDVFIQIGYSDYIPKYCKYKKMVGYSEMDSMCEKASVIITHGGPGSIMQAWKYGKKPIVVPRNPKYDEHVDEHQILFTRKIFKTNKIIPVYDINELETEITNFLISSNNNGVKFESNNSMFVKSLEELLEKEGLLTL